jgi:hypothetical protein
MVEITKMLDGVWKRKSNSDQNSLKNVPEKTDIIRSPDRRKEKRYSWSPGKSDLGFDVKIFDTPKESKMGNTRVRPKSYAEPSIDPGDF